MTNKAEVQKLNQEIQTLNKEIEKVMQNLDEIKSRMNKNKNLKDDAIIFIEKTEKIIKLVEEGKISITEEQKIKLSKTLLNILTIYKK